MGVKLGDVLPLTESETYYGCQACSKLRSNFKLVVCDHKEGLKDYSEVQFYCEDCIDTAKEHLMDQHNVGTCDWCKGSNLIVKPHRDFEEGNNGPVYDVCKACRVKESASLDAEETGWDV